MSGHQLRGLSTAQYLLTSAKSRVRVIYVNLKLYKLVPGTGTQLYTGYKGRLQKKKEEKEKSKKKGRFASQF